MCLTSNTKFPKQDIATLIERLKSRTIEERDFETIIQWLEVAQELVLRVQEKEVTIKRLRQWLFGERSEKRKTSSKPPDPDETVKKKRRGHGRLSADDYKNADTEQIGCKEHQVGDRCCNECDGTLREIKQPSIPYPN